MTLDDLVVTDLGVVALIAWGVTVPVLAYFVGRNHGADAVLGRGRR